MNATDAMTAALDAAGLKRARLMALADAGHNVIDRARKLVDLPDVEGQDSMAFWEAYGALRDAVQALDGTGPWGAPAGFWEGVDEKVQRFEREGARS